MIKKSALLITLWVISIATIGITINYVNNIEAISIKKTITWNKVWNNFERAKSSLERNVYNDKVMERKEIYCGCKYDAKKKTIDCPFKPTMKIDRGLKIEWEHVVPAENFGANFSEWKSWSPTCSKKWIKWGRECAKTNPDFARMEGDMYNLYPANGELNGLRSNRDYGIVSSNVWKQKLFPECDVKIDYEKDKFEPPTVMKGELARVSLYFAKVYPDKYKLTDIKKSLFESWDVKYPVSPLECKRYEIIKKLQWTDNPILASKCKK